MIALWLACLVVISLVVITILIQAYFASGQVQSSVTRTGAQVELLGGSEETSNPTVADPANIVYGPELGYPCVTSADCGDGMTCDGICRSTVGGSCVLSTDCAENLECRSGTCRSPTNNSCPCPWGQACDPITSQCKYLSDAPQDATRTDCYSGVLESTGKCATAYIGAYCSPHGINSALPHCSPGYACVPNKSGDRTCQPGLATETRPDAQLIDTAVPIGSQSELVLARSTSNVACMSNTDCLLSEACVPLANGFGVCTSADRGSGRGCNRDINYNVTGVHCRNDMVCLREPATNHTRCTINLDDVTNLMSWPEWYRDSMRCPSGYANELTCTLPDYSPVDGPSICDSGQINTDLRSATQWIDYNSAAITSSELTESISIPIDCVAARVNGIGEVTALTDGTNMILYDTNNEFVVSFRVIDSESLKEIPIVRLNAAVAGTEQSTNDIGRRVSRSAFLTIMVFNSAGRFEVYALGNRTYTPTNGDPGPTGVIRREVTVFTSQLIHITNLSLAGIDFDRTVHFVPFYNGAFILSSPIGSTIRLFRLQLVRVNDNQFRATRPIPTRPPPSIRLRYINPDGDYVKLAPLFAYTNAIPFQFNDLIVVNSTSIDGTSLIYPTITAYNGAYPFLIGDSNEGTATGEVFTLAQSSSIRIDAIGTAVIGDQVYIMASVRFPLQSYNQLRGIRFNKQHLAPPKDLRAFQLRTHLTKGLTALACHASGARILSQLYCVS